MGNSRILALAALAGLAVAVAGSAADGRVLGPGGSGSPDVLTRMLTGNPPGGEVALASGTFVSNLGASDFSGSYVEYVYRGNNYGANDLTWYIEVTNNKTAGADSINTVVASGFKGITSDVGYCNTTGTLGAYNGKCYNEGTVLPNFVSRGSNGVAIDWSLIVPPNGSTTDWLMIATNATETKSGYLSLGSSGFATVGGYGAAIPEARSWAMLGIGFAGIGLVTFAKRRRQPRFTF